MAAIHILHLTDLHLRAQPTWDQGVLLDALRADLTKLRFSQMAPSFVVFSGDLAQAAKEPTAYESVLNYTLAILDVLDLDESRMIVCPGNHDIDQAVVGANLPLLKRWRQESATISGANELSILPAFQSYTRNAFECYNAFASEFGTNFRTDDRSLSSTYYVRDLGLAFLTINTAALSGAGLAAEFEDRGNLAVAERSLLEGLSTAPSGVPIIVVGHHPPHWLNDTSSSLLDTVLSKQAIAYLSGHLHESRPRNIHSATGDYLHVQSGALYSSRDYWNGFAVVSVDSDRLFSRVAFRRWFEQRREFARAEDVGDAGLFYSSPDSELYWNAITPSVDPIALDRWRSIELLPELMRSYQQFMSLDNVSDIFVPPNFDREIPFRVETEGRLGSRLEVLSYQDILTSSENYVVSARPETGKSTLLRRLALDITRLAKPGQMASIPVVIPFSAVRSYEKYVETLIRQTLPELPPGFSVKSLLESGSLCVLIDDVDFTATAKRNALVSAIKAFPKCRYVFTSSTHFVESSALTPEIVPGVPFTRIRLRKIENRQLLTLIEKHGTVDPLKADQMLERLLRDANALNVPLTAVTGTFLIQILIDDPDHVLVNQAALIERYIEMLLQKYAPRELLPGTFDFRNKVDLLCFVSERMVRRSDYSPSENILTEWCIEYLAGYGLLFSARDLVSYFIEARVFEKSASHISFRLRMFFEFFVAMRMMDDFEFREYIFNEDNYLLFANEIGFYSALSRKDKVQLERIYVNFTKLTQTVWSAEKGIVPEDEFSKNL